MQYISNCLFCWESKYCLLGNLCANFGHQKYMVCKFPCFLKACWRKNRGNSFPCYYYGISHCNRPGIAHLFTHSPDPLHHIVSEFPFSWYVAPIYATAFPNTLQDLINVCLFVCCRSWQCNISDIGRVHSSQFLWPSPSYLWHLKRMRYLQTPIFLICCSNGNICNSIYMPVDHCNIL